MTEYRISTSVLASHLRDKNMEVTGAKKSKTTVHGPCPDISRTQFPIIALMLNFLWIEDWLQQNEVSNQVTQVKADVGCFRFTSGKRHN